MTTIKEFIKQIIDSGRPIREVLGGTTASAESSTPSPVPAGGGDDNNMNTAQNFDVMETLRQADEAQAEENALAAQRLALIEQDFDVVPDGTPVAPPVQPSTIPAPPSEVTPTTFVMPPTEYMHKGIRHKLICEGTCVNCARCAMKLTDAVSIERGLGPDCSQKGYDEDPVNSDEMQAFIDLAEYPELATYLAAKYKPLGVRALMNGLVKIASLNRKSPGLHGAICDAIDSLGYKRLSASLRDSISILEIKDARREGYYQVWVKRDSWSYNWQNELKRISGLGQYGRLPKGDNKGVLIPKSAKRALWEAMLRFFPGCIARTPAGTVKIERQVVEENKDRPSSPPPAP